MKPYTRINMVVLICLAFAFLTNCGGSSSRPSNNPSAITATSGTPQSATVGTAFSAPLAAKVTNSSGTGISGVSVTFTAPASGASGAFQGGTSTETATTNASGVATSSTFTANTLAGSYSVAATTGSLPSAHFNLTNTAGAASSITATSGTPQSTAISTAFANPLVATVTDSNGNPVSGVSVTFTSPDPTSLASCQFTNGTNTEVDTTDTSGNATSSTCTANSLEGGPYTVKATASVGEADFSLTNTAVVVTSHNYVFYLNGLETINNVLGLNYYALAGSVTIDPNGNVVAGEQDYNDGFGLTSPQSGDSITGGTLTVDNTGQGTLTLVTDNPSLGLGGTETLGVQFTNTKHARIIHFDGSATSSGSLDMQTATSLTASMGFAFTFSGVDSSYNPVGVGGVFSTDAAGTSINGVADVNAAGTVTTLSPFSGTATAADSLGRGSITGVSFDGMPIAINYYVVGPEVVRIIDVDTSDSAIGSVFGQGSATFSNASLGSSIFGILDTPWDAYMGAAGMFSTNAGAGTFQGVGDVDEGGISVSDSAITGTYSISASGTPNGYGSLTIDNGGLQDVSAMGIYMTDPNLNLIDPNNPSGGGGALVLGLDIFPGASGVIVPQTDTSAASFAGNYAFGGQEYNISYSGWEFDFVGQGSVAGAVPALTGTGLVNDDLLFFTTVPAVYSAVPFSGTATPDGANPGRYTMNPLVVTVAGLDNDFDTVIYQASGNQLLWLEKNSFGLFLGTFEKQGSLTGLPAVRRPVIETKSNQEQ